MPVPVTTGPQLQARRSGSGGNILAGYPTWVWALGGGIILAVGWKLYSIHKASTASTTNAASSTATQPVSNPETQVGQASNIWPYDQLTSPYDTLNMPGMNNLTLDSSPYASDTFSNVNGTLVSA